MYENPNLMFAKTPKKGISTVDSDYFLWEPIIRPDSV